MPNRLGGTRSAYLRSAAHQPVDWYPWGDEAFARARAEDRPVLLDVGAVWCHWCHVIDRESYEDPETAAIINARFVPVKVDRDERPDVDVRYQNAVSTISGQGGWPLTAFLTPEGKVFFGGTYFPPDTAAGRPGFKQVLLAVAEFYRTKREQAHAYSNELHQALHRLGDARASEEALSPALVETAAAAIERHFDPVHGGFGGAPKFPHAGAIELLLRRYDRTRAEGTLSVAVRTLEHMARGGVYDQVGGGFHRYSVDASWTVPHFEKMLYDNSELLRNYAHTYSATGMPLFHDTASGIARYVAETLVDGREGGFFASQDADVSLHDDGDYYTWTLDEAAAALDPDELAAVRIAYGLDGPGEMQHDRRRHVLFVSEGEAAVASRLGRSAAEVRALLSSGLRRLSAARAGRPAPVVDRAIYAGWNGMMISAFLDAARALPSGRDLRGAALRALDRALRDAYRPGRGFRHTVNGPGVEGLLDDQVQVSRALLDAFEQTGDGRYFDAARETVEYVLAEFRAPSGALYDVARSAEPAGRPLGLAVPYVPVQDSPTPSGNAVAAMVLDRLAALTGDARYRGEAERILRACAPGQMDHGLFAATLALALDLHLDPPLHVVVVGAREDPRTRALHETALRTYRPGTIAHLYDPAASRGRLPTPVAALASSAAKPLAYACTADACAAPAAEPDALRETILTFGRAVAA